MCCYTYYTMTEVARDIVMLEYDRAMQEFLYGVER